MLRFCVFIYRLTCAGVFKCILNYILIQQNVKQSLLDSFLNLHFKTVTLTLEKCLFFAFLNGFLNYYLKIEKCPVNYRKIIKWQKPFFHLLFSLCTIRENKFAMFFVILYAFYDLMYRWLKIC